MPMRVTWSAICRATFDGEKMTDNYGRKIEYLRISVTDACNLRCGYCMPKSVQECNCAKNLRADELLEIATAAAQLGVRKLRITGGEPLVRRDIVELTRALASIDGIEDISMTTNATLLAPIAKELFDAGIHRINISLDTLSPERYRRMTNGGSLSDATEGIKAALKVGMSPVKLNCVLIGGVNSDETESLARLTQKYPVDVRFIELMPIGDTAGFGAKAYLPVSYVTDVLPELEPVEARSPSSVAREFTLPDALGRVGLISPLSNHFCASCNRLRLTADGCIKPCLHSAEEISVRGLHGDELKAAILTATEHKPKMHVELSAVARSQSKRSMNRIGG